MLSTCRRALKAPLTPIPARWHVHAEDSPLTRIALAISLAGALVAAAIAVTGRYSVSVPSGPMIYVADSWDGTVKRCSYTDTIRRAYCEVVYPGEVIR
jgi:hypothetical protein